jgi:proline iminopeptidase
VPLPPLYPDPPLLRTHALPVSGGHVLQVQEFGAADGIPAVVLHGGPGSGCSPLLRRFFDPARYRIVCPDQRGSGGSRPRGGIEHNSTDDLLADLRRVREHLGIARWLVTGGSWGSTLAVAYAAAEPGAVTGLLLRASFLARPQDIAGFFGELSLATLAEALCSNDATEREAAALTWWQREQALAGTAASAIAPAGEALAFQVDRLRVQAHYLVHGCWLQAPTLLERCEALPRVPTRLIHARDDRICPADGAIALHQRLPFATLHWIDEGGHDPAHPALTGATVAALDHFAAHGGFGGPA